MAEKLKVYLDTNMVHDFFVNQAVYEKKGEEPSKEKVDFVTSFLTKAGIIRELVSAHSMDSEDVLLVWDRFLESSESQCIESAVFDEKLVEIVGKMRMRLRTMFNFLHIFLAVESNIYFVSGDKDIVSKIRENKIYEKVMTYGELRNFIEKGDD